MQVIRYFMRIFVSSTSKDLKRHREAVRDAILSLNHQPIMMEDFNASNSNAVESCHKQVVRSNLFVGIYAYRYGTIPNYYEKSITELEYDWATQAGKHRLIFIHDPNKESEWATGEDFREPKDIEKYHQLQAFKQRLLDNHIVAFFDTPELLQAKVSTSIHEYITNQQRIRLIAGIIVSLLILISTGLGFALYSKWDSEVIEATIAPQSPAIGYEILLDTSAAMGESFNGTTRYDIAVQAIENIADAGLFKKPDRWGGLRTVGGSSCGDTTLIAFGYGIGKDDFLAPLYEIEPTGIYSAYKAGIDATFVDLDNVVQFDTSRHKAIFIILGSFNPAGCPSLEPLPALIKSYNIEDVSPILCVFVLTDDTQESEDIRREAAAIGLDCFLPVTNSEDISDIAIDIIKDIETKIEQEDSIILPTQIVLSLSETPKPTPIPIPIDSAFEMNLYDGPSVNTTLLRTIPQGSDLFLLSCQNSDNKIWCLMEHDGLKGWTTDHSFTELPPGHDNEVVLMVTLPPTFTPVLPTRTGTLARTPSITYTLTPTYTLTHTPTLDFVEIVETLDAQGTAGVRATNVAATATQAVFVGQTQTAIIGATETATFWTDTPTQDVTASIDAFTILRAIDQTQTEIASWTDTPTLTSSSTANDCCLSVSEQEREIYSAINVYRESSGLPAFSYDSLLSEVAQQVSTDISLGCEYPLGAESEIASAAGYPGDVLAVYYCANQFSVEQVIDNLLRSGAILQHRFIAIGIAVQESQTSVALIVVGTIQAEPILIISPSPTPTP